MKKTTRITESYDEKGNLTERIVEIEEEEDVNAPVPYWPVTPTVPNTTPYIPLTPGVTIPNTSPPYQVYNEQAEPTTYHFHTTINNPEGQDPAVFEALRNFVHHD